MNRKFNNSTYYLIPLNEITEEMINLSDQNSIQTMRKSVRPIDKKIHGILTFGTLGATPDFLRRYTKKGFSHEKTLEIINSSIEWNLSLPLTEFTAVRFKSALNPSA